MTLMIDRLDHTALHRHVDTTEPWHEDMLLDRVPCFEITNVADLAYRMDLFDRRAQGGIALHAEKFPNVGPPYRSYWMEWRNPPSLDPYKSLQRFGIWCVITDETNDDQWSIMCVIFIGKHKPHVVGRFALTMTKAGEFIDPGTLVIMPEAVDEIFALRSRPRPPLERHTVDPEMDAFITKIERDLQGLSADEVPGYRERRLIELREKAAELDIEIEQLREKAEKERENAANVVGDSMRIGVLPPLLLAHSLLGCKNVDRDEHMPDPKMNRAAIKRRGHGLTKFTTLSIRTMGGGGDSGDRVQLGNGQTALHLVRGHFKTFTPERPLLGKHVGTYWWSPNVRGKEEHGVVVKDYKVDA